MRIEKVGDVAFVLALIAVDVQDRITIEPWPGKLTQWS